MEPPAPEPAEALEGLGHPVDEFRAGTGHYVLSFLVGVIAFVLGAVALAGLIALLFMGPPGKRGFGLGLVKLATLALVFMLGGMSILYRAVSARGLRVLVFSEGLARLQGGKVETLRWEDVNAVKRVARPAGQGEGFSLRLPVELVLEDRHGRALVFNESVARLRELRRLAEQHTLPHMLPPAREALDSGATIGFGAVSAGPEGLHLADRAGASDTLAWDAYQDAEAGGGFLTVRSAGARKPFCRLPLADVPNAHVLLALAEHARYRYG
jgi:hypothetical protein